MSIQDHIRALYNDYTKARDALDYAQYGTPSVNNREYAKLDDAVIDAHDKLMDAIKIVTGLTSDELEKIR